MSKYIVKSGDTLSKIAKQKKLDLETLLSANPQITDASKIRVGQKIEIPEKPTDIPPKPDPEIPDFVPSQVSHFLSRARSASGNDSVYKLGAGGMSPGRIDPTDSSRRCDCSGFVCWALGISRKTTHPLYTRFNNGWINTDGMVHDAKNQTGFFSKLEKPKVGCIVVYPGRKVDGVLKIGHVGIVTEVKAGKPTKVLHCSSGNYRNLGDAIMETSPKVFLRPDAVYAWYEGLS